MSIASVTALFDALRENRLLEPAQLESLTGDLQRRYSDPQSLLQELVARSWLTSYQAQKVFNERGSQLLLGSYILVEKLGEGGMGQVFKARNWKLGKTVALKLIRKERLDSEDAIRRFQREIRAAAQLNHPNIVHAYDADEVGGTHLLVMEYVEGLDLAKLVKQSGPLAVPQACDYIRQAALGLQHAHEAGLVHRDIKPHNLLVSGGVVSGESSSSTHHSPPTTHHSPLTTHQIKILDMGLARLIHTSDSSMSSATMTKEGSVLGTPDYIAPEQAMESHDVDIRADIYSLGCTFYFLLVGRAPFASDPLLEKLIKHQFDEPKRVEELRPDIPAGVTGIVRKMMAKRPDDRYQTPGEVAAALAEGLGTGIWNVPEPASRGRKPPDPATQPATASSSTEVGWAAIAGASPLAAELPANRDDMRQLRRHIKVGGSILAGLLAVLGLLLWAPWEAKNKKPVSEMPDSSPAKIEVEPEKPITNSIGMKLAYIPAGKFLMGAPAAEIERFKKESPDWNPNFMGGPQHEVRITKAFYLGIHEVRQAEYEKVIGKNPAKFKDPDNPIETVSWDEAMLFCNQLSELPEEKRARRVYRLPTEAEWEYACRAGTTTVYHFGDGLSSKQANFHGDFPSGGAAKGPNVGKTSKVGSYAANAWGLHDMHGNIVEWCLDAPRTYTARPVDDPKGEGNTRVLRGGHWAGPAWFCRSALRHASLGVHWRPEIGFRVLCELPARAKPQPAPALATATRVDEGWLQSVQQMTPERQVSAVAKKLKELNPGFDAKVEHAIANGKVTHLTMNSDDVKDLSPVKALAGLLSFHIMGNGFADVTPLSGMQLTTVTLGGKGLKDLTALKGMPLTSLNIGGSSVSDLTPLKGMPLTTLLLHATSVSDLTPLAGMKLTNAMFYSTPVADLSPLEGMPLTHLSFNATRVQDLSVLKEMPLQELQFDFKPYRDTEVLRSIKTLESINGKRAVEFWKETDATQAAFDIWVKQVQDMPADKQVEAVATKLKERNPGFDGKVTHQLEGDAVVSLQFFTDSVTDIAAVRALQKLQTLKCGGSGDNKGILADLWPLKGMQLTHADLGATKISDLSPLKGMPLSYLSCYYTPVADLSPLTGMPLTRLSIGATGVADLAPLKGMSLTFLDCYASRVRDLTPLKGMPLTDLSSHGTPATDLSPLQGMPLSYLSTSTSELSPLKGMPLKQLNFGAFDRWRDGELLRSIKTLEKINGKPVAEFWKPYDEFDAWVKQVGQLPAEQQVEAVAEKLKELNPGFDGKVTHKLEGGVVTELKFSTEKVADISAVRALPGLKVLDCATPNGKLSDLSPLKGMRLTTLQCSFNPVADLAPLLGMPLTALGLHYTHVKDLVPLKNMPLKLLGIEGTQIADLSPLKGTPLEQMQCAETKIADLSPLQGAPLTHLDVGKTAVSDLAPLKGMPLKALQCHFTNVSDLSPLKDMPLESLYCVGTSVSDFNPLKGMPLKKLGCDFKPERDAAILRSIKTLETINGKPAAEFLKP